jgi:AraC-like DNA-binding protein
MLYLGGVGLAFFLTLLLVTKNQKTVADKILAGWLFVITIHLLVFYLLKMERYPQLLGTHIPFPLLHGPFLYLYTMALTNRTVPLKFSLLHFVPFLSVVFYLIPFFIRSTEEKIFVFKNQGVEYEVFNKINLFLIIASGVVYVILSSIALQKHRISIANQFSSIDKINLRWLQHLIYGIGAIWIFVILGNDDLIFAAAALFILFVGFFGIRQVGIFHSTDILASTPNRAEPNLIGPTRTENNAIEASSFQAEPEKRKYQKSGLSAETSETLHHDLTRIMNSEKLFRESELSLSELATRLNTQPNYLSQVINEREGKIFYDYINTIRIEEFRRLAALPNSRKYTLLALAEQCGFKSKSSFNRYFKKVTGQSPSEFMKTVSNSEN